MIASASDFVEELSIPNRGQAATAESINWYIAKYEPKFLEMLLGVGLVLSLNSGLTGLPSVPIASDTDSAFYMKSGNDLLKVSAEKFGVAGAGGYTLAVSEVVDSGLAVSDNVIGDNSKWLLLRDKIKPALLSYIYWYYRRGNASNFTGNGETVPFAENSTIISPQDKMVRVWNEMYDLCLKFVQEFDSSTYGVYYSANIQSYGNSLKYRGSNYGSYHGYFGVNLPDIFYPQNTFGI